MSKADRLKAEIAFHEKMFFAALAVIIGLLGWSASNFMNTSYILLGFAFLAITGAVSFGLYQYRIIKQLIQELDDA